MSFEKAYIPPKRQIFNFGPGVGNIQSLRLLLSKVLTSKFFACVVSLVFLCLIASHIESAAFWEASQRLTLNSVLFAAAVILVNIILSSLRLGAILRDFGFSLPIVNTFRANIYGHLAGMVLFQVVGQALGRSALLKRFGVSLSAVVVITAYERLLGLTVALVFAAVGAFHLFGMIAVDTSSGGATFIKIAIGVLGACIAGIALGYHGLVRRALGWLKNKSYTANILKAVFHTCVSQAFMLAAYVSLAHILVPSIALSHLLAACAIVSLAAALPISFSGWGVRELSAIYALGILGVNSEDALLVSVMVGVLSLFMMIVLSMFLSLISSHSALRHEKLEEGSNVIFEAAQPSLNFTLLIAWFVPLAVATAIFFQLYLPTNAGKLNVNLADPLVIVGGPALLILSYLRYQKWPLWKIEHFSLFAMIATGFITFSFLIGVYRFGVTDWAFINRFMGWFVVLGYITTGALITFVEKEFAQKLVLRTFVAVAVSIVVFDMLLYSLFDVLINFKIKPPENFIFYRSEGFAQDPNAFAFQLVLALSVLFGFYRHRLWGMSSKIPLILMALLLVGIWNTLSRAGFLGVGGIIILALSFKLIDWKILTKASLIALGCLLFMAYMPIIVQQFAVSTSGSKAGGAFSQLNIYDTLAERKDSNTERMVSMQKGLKLFYENPIWGAGLGAFIHKHGRDFKKPLVIHSTPVWLLVEFGAIGFLFFTGCFLWMFWKCIPFVSKFSDPLKSTAFLALCAFAIMAMVHDLFYQRAFWFLLGVCFAYSVRSLKQKSPLAS